MVVAMGRDKLYDNSYGNTAYYIGLGLIQEIMTLHSYRHSELAIRPAFTDRILSATLEHQLIWKHDISLDT